MSEDAAIRRTNFQQLCKQRSWAPSELPKVMGWGRDTYWRDLLTNPKKSFGEKIARRIEGKLDLTPRGWLDEDREARKKALYPRAMDNMPAGDAPHLPFTPALVNALMQCDELKLWKLENTLRVMLDMPQLAEKRKLKRG